ncbi:uncharacterized protein BT62DRAFT_895972, partial [Guyanagaster necrorhizus]
FLLSQQVYSGTLYLVYHMTIINKQWAKVVKYYMKKGAYAQTSLQQSFLVSKYPDRANIHQFLKEL